MISDDLLATLTAWDAGLHHCLHAGSGARFRPGSAEYICCQCGAEDPTKSSPTCSEHEAHEVLPLTEALDYAARDCACPDRQEGLAIPADDEHVSIEGCHCPCHTASSALAHLAERMEAL